MHPSLNLSVKTEEEVLLFIDAKGELELDLLSRNVGGELQVVYTSCDAFLVIYRKFD